MKRKSLLLLALFCALPVFAEPVIGDKNTQKEPEKLSYGLTQKQIHILHRVLHLSVDELGMDEEAVSDLAFIKKLNCDVVPFLLAVRDKKKRDEFFGEKCIASDFIIIYWLALTGDPRVEDAVYRFFEETLPKIISCQNDSSMIGYNMYAISKLGTKKSQDMLFSMLEKDYWKNTNIKFDMPARDPNSAETENQDRILHLRCQAMGILAGTGTDTALQAMASGKGIPEDLWEHLTPSLFESAAYSKVKKEGYKLQKIPAVTILPMNPAFAEDRTLPEDTKRRLIEIYQTYGKTFVEPPPVQKMPVSGYNAPPRCPEL
jgi:hypothetical protein